MNLRTFVGRIAGTLLALFLAEQSAHAFYDPSLGRWINRDPIKERGGINLYGFVGNNPVDYVDLRGLDVTGVFDTGTGLLTLTDNQTHEAVSVYAESGGNPFGQPVPSGPYDILEQGGRPDFYRLEPLDNPYGDDKHNATGRNKFRLHKPGRTIGCIAVKSREDWKQVKDLLEKTERERRIVESKSRNPFAPSYEELLWYGTINVIDSTKRLPTR